MNVIKILIIICLCYSCGNIQKDNRDENRKISNTKNTLFNINGDWEIEQIPEILYINNDTAYVTVIDGQIHIKAKVEYEKDMVFLKLIKPSFLGMGGARLNWKSFSHTKNVAVITPISEDTIKFEWLGFFDKKINQRVFTICGYTSDNENWALLSRVKE